MIRCRLLSSRAIGCCALAAVVWLAGCGYQQSGDYNHPRQGAYQWHSLYREDIATVAVPIFQNKDFRRGIEFRLTKAVINQMEALTPYKVVPRDRADTVLEGEIVNVDVSTLSRSYDNNIPQEQLLIMTLNFRWRDLRTGRILMERKNFQDTATWYPTLGEGEFVADQQTIEQMAKSVVREMEADW